MTLCPICGKGQLKQVQEQHALFGVSLGMYPGQKCSVCGELFTAASVMKKIEQVAKQKGIWGLGRKTKISKSGNSLAVRIPKELAEHLNLKEGKTAYLHPEEGKIVVDF